jgi:serine/threonine protein kinase
VIHGDLKGANVLIDDGERALLCDFGLSEMKVDVDSRSSDKHSDASEGSRPWMAPERLRGSPLRKPCDIYSLALTMYEVCVPSLTLDGLGDSMILIYLCRRSTAVSFRGQAYLEPTSERLSPINASALKDSNANMLLNSATLGLWLGVDHAMLDT